jgi:hypothetical protein
MLMKRALASVLLLAPTTLAVVGLTNEAQAETLELPRSRQGYYLGGGLHFGASRFVEEGDSLGSWFTRTLRFDAGQMLTRQLGLGLNLELGSATRSGEMATLVGLGAEGQWEVLPNLAFHGGFGFSVISITNPDARDEQMRGSYGGQYALAVSYDWFPFRAKRSGGLALTPIAMVKFAPSDSVSATVFTLGLELTWWKGLPKNELQLPAGEGYEK